MSAQIENPLPPWETHEEACASVAARFRSRWLRSYVAAKLRRDPVFKAVAELLLESREPLLDIGCGVGLLPLYLRARGFSGAVRGIELDTRKAREARALGLDVVDGDASETLPPLCGNVALLDVLHYLKPQRQAVLLREAAARVASGAILLLRDCPNDRSVRYFATHAGELFAQAISWNIGVRLHFPTRDSIHAAFPATEFTHEERPMYEGSPFNNRLWIFRRVAVPGLE